MSFKANWYQEKLRKKVKRGFQGYPIVTVTCYGTDDQHASKISAGLILEEGGELSALESWHNPDIDIRKDATTIAAVLAFITQHQALTVIAPERILGCPHEAGTDYPANEKCPQCSYWANRDRFTGKLIA